MITHFMSDIPPLSLSPKPLLYCTRCRLRREKQEDRYCVMPRFPTPTSHSASATEESGRGSGLAQGFFGVYDGHCGSEAVQFVRDRLHAMVEEHASFAEVRD